MHLDGLLWHQDFCSHLLGKYFSKFSRSIHSLKDRLLTGKSPLTPERVVLNALVLFTWKNVLKNAKNGKNFPSALFPIEFKVARSI